MCGFCGKLENIGRTLLPGAPTSAARTSALRSDVRRPDGRRSDARRSGPRRSGPVLRGCLSDCAVHLEHFALIVHDYDFAIAFFVEKLGFELVEDSPAVTTNDGRPKRWVVVRPPNASTGLLLAQADGELQSAAVGQQFAGRVGLFLRVDDFQEAYDRMREGGVEFASEPRSEVYGQVAVFVDVAGNRWDLLGPPLDH